MATQGYVTVSETGTGKFAQRVEIGDHVLASDEPVEVGGNDSGPSPIGFMLASLGSCTSMTLRAYAAYKKWALGPIRVDVGYRRMKDETGASHDQFDRVIHVDGPLTDEERAKLVEIAGKCPMHKLLMATDKVIETRVA
ncbi:MAG TPA: OsmC family protein [Alphaproteobacteria bacterium]|jgi:putative redox protein